jgi:hypothetical protein
VAWREIKQRARSRETIRVIPVGIKVVAGLILWVPVQPAAAADADAAAGE